MGMVASSITFDLAEEVSRLREELKKFEDVNLHSIKEFEAVERRYNELLSHKENNESARSKLYGNINMLSGGEKTLCVIGLLPSFYLVHPSSFLILEKLLKKEVDLLIRVTMEEKRNIQGS